MLLYSCQIPIMIGYWKINDPYKDTWRVLILDEMAKYNESFDDVVLCTITDEELDISFDAVYGHVQGKPFTLWTKNKVYFPCTFDGSEFVGSVSRDPDGISTDHIG